MSSATQIAERRAACNLTRTAYERTWRSKARDADQRGGAWWHANYVIRAELRHYAEHLIAEGCEMVYWEHPEFLGANQ